jgi:hypothetical protein
VGRLLDNPNDYAWEPDPHVPSNRPVVPLCEVDWPLDEHGSWLGRLIEYRQFFMVLTPVYPQRTRKIVEPVPVDPVVELQRELNRLRKKKIRLTTMIKKEAEMLEEQVKQLQTEVDQLERRYLKEHNKRIALLWQPLTVGNLLALTAGVSEHAVLEVRESGGRWRFCTYEDVRVLIERTGKEDVVRQLAVVDGDVEDLTRL